ncbi:MAG: hypothetical protein R3C71_11220 [Candidatus Krumholzibacteriia bacterium]|nr:hypothetical protein [Candidatus Latescibacterota bacterium]MCB9516707.1 hypothetical protein [Candidatus Latescibacterota bacterium]
MPKARPFQPSEEAVQSLIRRADGHPLGRGFLLKGSLDAVAATFGVHAFVVDRARESLAAADAGPARPPDATKTLHVRRKGA